MSNPVLPEYFSPPEPPADMELTDDNICKLHDELKEWYIKKTPENLDRHGNVPSFVLGELNQLRALYDLHFGINYKCTSYKCKDKRGFSEAVAAYHAGRYISPIIYQQGVQFTKEAFPKICEDKKYCCPRCKRPVKLMMGLPSPYGLYAAVPIE
tara:strand:+ start:534 stop:995 length:462 start_codon:yes stop_codon:yes gene_type:complete